MHPHDSNSKNLGERVHDDKVKVVNVTYGNSHSHPVKFIPSLVFSLHLSSLMFIIHAINAHTWGNVFWWSFQGGVDNQ